MKDVNELAANHWTYVKGVLMTENEDVNCIALPLEDYLNRIRFHYETAFIHGYKHGSEEVRRGAVPSSKKP